MPGNISSNHSNAVGNLMDVSVSKPIIPQSISLSTDKGDVTQVELNSHLTLMPSFSPSNTTYKQVTWSISDPTKAKIDDNVVTFLQQGSVKITATSNYDSSLSDSITFDIVKIEVSQIIISSIPDLKVGDKKSLSVTVLPANATYRDYTLSVDGDCVSLGGSTLSAIKSGVATITAVSNDNPAVSHSITVTVIEKSVNLIVFVSDDEWVNSISLEQGESVDLSLIYLPIDATNAQFDWSIDGELGIEFRSPYLVTVTATTVGESTLTARLTSNSSIYAFITITTTESSVVHDKVIGLSDSEMSMAVGESLSIEIHETTENGRDARASYSYHVYQGQDVISINSLGLVTALKQGTAKVRVELVDSDLFATVTITVTDVYIDELHLSLPTESIYVGQSYTLGCSYLPSNATSTHLTWSVSDTSVASITQAGVIKFNKAGSVTVSVTATGGTTESAFISAHNVLDISNMSCIGFDVFDGFTDGCATATIVRNGCAQINATFAQNATYKELEITSSNQNVLAVDGNKVTALKTGKATITILYHDGDENNVPVSYEIEVTVKAQKLSSTISNWARAIRKGLGHFAAFFVLGVFGALTFALFLKRKWLALVISLVSGFGIASLTEFLQMLVPNRGPSFSDVLLDFYGFSLATVLTFCALIVCLVIKTRKDKKAVPDSTQSPNSDN